MQFKFEDYTSQVTDALNDSCISWLYEVAGEIKSQVVKNASKYSDTGDTRNSYEYKVDEGNLVAYVGSPLQNALWEEFGTGEYALNKNGRPTPWYVPVELVTGRKKPTFKGKVVKVTIEGKEYYKTNGKKPRRHLFNAFAKTEKKAEKRLKSLLKELNMND